MNSRTLAVTANVQSEIRINQPYKWVAIIKAGGDITLKNAAGEEALNLPALTVHPFSTQMGDYLRVTSTLSETITLEWGSAEEDMPILPSLSTSGGASAGSVKGQYPEGTDINTPDNPLVNPFLGGTRNRELGGIIKAFDSTQDSPARDTGAGTFYALAVQKMRNDQPDALVIEPDNQSGLDWLADKQWLVLTVDFADVTDALGISAFQGTATPASGPVIFNKLTGLPVTTPGIIDGTLDGPGTYEIDVAGISGLVFDTTGNTDDVTLTGSLIGG